MSESVHFTNAPAELQKEYILQLDTTAKEMGRTNSRDDRVDWSAVNDKMVSWWEEKSYIFP